MKNQVDFQSYIDAGTQAYFDGDYATGGKIFLAAMKDAKRLKLKDARLVAILYNLALFYHQQGRPKKAEVLLEKALSCAEAIFGRNADPIDHILNRLADLQVAERQYKRAEGLYERSLQIERRILAQDDPLLAKKLMKMAWVYCMQGNYDSAETHLKEALDLQINAARVKQQMFAPKIAVRPAAQSENDKSENDMSDVLLDDFALDEIEMTEAGN